MYFFPFFFLLDFGSGHREYESNHKYGTDCHERWTAIGCQSADVCTAKPCKGRE